jgi:hypothetical protein
MNGTVIDIPGITVNVSTVTSAYTPDLAHTIEIKDGKGNVVTLFVCYGRITDVFKRLK